MVRVPRPLMQVPRRWLRRTLTAPVLTIGLSVLVGHGSGVRVKGVLVVIECGVVMVSVRIIRVRNGWTTGVVCLGNGIRNDM